MAASRRRPTRWECTGIRSRARWANTKSSGGRPRPDESSRSSASSRSGGLIGIVHRSEHQPLAVLFSPHFEESPLKALRGTACPRRQIEPEFAADHGEISRDEKLVVADLQTSRVVRYHLRNTRGCLVS